MNTREKLRLFVIDKTGARESEVTDAVDINNGLGCCGDDFHELMEAYATTFGVDMKEYRWYFHTEEEGLNLLGGAFFKPPNERVEHIPVTLEVLERGVQLGRWPISYPAHTIPKRRWDLAINGLLLIIVLAWAAVSLLKGC